MIGKKKSQDVQFYSEGGPNAEDVGGRGRGGYGGQDEDDEQRQKEARRKLDKQFKAWIVGCEQFTGKHFKFQMPNRQAGFYGNPFNNNCLLQPTKSCLINVTQSRFFVVAIDDIEIVCFERMYSNVKSFDIIFLMKDYENFVKVSSIPIKDVEKVKDWLDKNNIIFYDQGKNLNWIKFLGTIRKDFKGFVDGGAWMAWDQADQEEEQLQQDEDESFSADSQQDDQESDEQSDSQQDYQNEDDSDSESGSGEQDLSQQGLSSDELDQRAEMQDRQRDRRQMERQRQKQRDKNNSKVNTKVVKKK